MSISPLLHLALLAVKLAAAAPMNFGGHDQAWSELYHQSWPQLPYSPARSDVNLPVDGPDMIWSPPPSWSHPSSPQYSIRYEEPIVSHLLHEDLTSTDSSPEYAPLQKSAASNVARNGPQTVSETSQRTTADKKPKTGSTSGVRKKHAITGWWEPDAVKKIPSVDALQRGKQGKVLFSIDPNPELRHQINRKLFAGKMHWVSENEMNLVSNADYRGMWPLRRTSRPIPFVDPPEGGVAPIRLYMTQHSNAKGIGSLKSGSPAARPRYMFWGVQETPIGTQIINYGAGYIDSADHEAVNRHLQPLLDGLASASKVHV